MIALGFVMSFSAVALLLSAITRAFDFDPNLLRTGAAILLARLRPADDLAGAVRVAGDPARRCRGQLSARPRRRQSLFGGFALGSTLGLVWTPCAGPVLGSILTIVATSKDTAWASLQLVTYAIGAAIPMLAIAYGGQAVTTRVRSLARIAPRLQQGFGVVIIAFAASVLPAIRHADRGVADPDSIPTARSACEPQRRVSMSPALACRIRPGCRPWSRRRRDPRPLQRGRRAGAAASALATMTAEQSQTAPEFVGISNWFNSQPLEACRSARQGRAGGFLDLWLRQLRQHAAACHRALFKVQRIAASSWSASTPEFPFEHSASNVQAALKRHGILYPVAQDNDSQTWNAYRNRYWPAQYIIDQNGKIVFQHAGEGQYDEIDRTVARLLNANS